MVEPERLVFTWGRPEDPVDAAPVVTVVLAEREGDDREGGTELTFALRGIPGRPGDADVYDGWASALGLLAEHVAR